MPVLLLLWYVAYGYVRPVENFWLPGRLGIPLDHWTKPHFLVPLLVCNHDGIAGGAAGAVPGLPPGRGTLCLRELVVVVVAARAVVAATSRSWAVRNEELLMCHELLRGMCPPLGQIMRWCAYDSNTNMQY